MPDELLAGAEVHEHEAAAALAHDVLRFDVAVQQPGAVHGGERGAQIEADERRFARAERAARLHGLLERLAAHELHPQADATVVLLGAVDLHDVRVTHAREPPRLFEDAGVCASALIALVVQQLERDFAVERRVPRAIDLAGRPVADAIEERRGGPSADRPRRPRRDRSGARL